MNSERFFILELPVSEKGYRGLQRGGPTPSCDDAVPTTALTEVILEYWDHATFQAALTVWRLLGSCRSRYEIIQVTTDLGPDVERAEGFLGYDVVELKGGWGSLLTDGWFIAPTWDTEIPQVVLMRVIFDHFGPHRNESLLFQDLITAQRFVKAVMALAQLKPGTFEDPEAEAYCPVGIRSQMYRIAADETYYNSRLSNSGG